MELLKISIVTTSYTLERLKDIKELLDSLESQTYRNIEMILVTERTEELAKSIKNYISEKGYKDIEVLFNQEEWGISAARNMGIKKAKGDIIAFIDDDAILLPDWAEETVKTYLQDSSIIGVAGAILPLWEDERMRWFPQEFYWILSCTYWEATKITEVRNGYGANLSFRKEAFEAAGLLKTSLGVRGRGQSGWQEPGAEEAEFSLRVKQKTGKRIVYNPLVKVKHKVYSYRIRTRFVAKRAYWEGYAKAMLKRWYKREAKEGILSTEYELLRRILFKFFPRTLAQLPFRPVTSLRQLWLAIVVLSCVTDGYLFSTLSGLLRRGHPYVG